MDLRLWWLATALITSVCHVALGENVTWPGCSARYEVVEVGKTNYNVTDLDLSDCNLTTSDLDNLKFYPYLQVVFLSGNKISQIKAGTFDSFTKLSGLYLQQNTFLGRDLPANLFQNWHLAEWIRIDFSDNNMTDTPADLLRGLVVYELNLNNCSLREIPSFVKRPVFELMFALHLNHNIINRLDDPDTFANNVNLIALYLNNNHIDFLHPELLKPLANIGYIFMRNNKIRVIPDGFFQNKPSLSKVNLDDNLIEYLPASAFTGTSLIYLSLSRNKLSHLPTNLFSELVTLKMFYFNRNPWELSCLDAMLKEIKKHNITYIESDDASAHKDLLVCK